MEHPSIVSPKLLEIAGTLTNHADASIQRKLFFTQQFWDKQSKVRAWLEPLRVLPRLANNWDLSRGWTCWTGSSEDEALALFQSCTFSNMYLNAGGAPENNDASGRAYFIDFIPRKFIEAVLTGVLAKNKFLIPGYARVEIEVEGKRLFDSGTATKTDGAAIVKHGIASRWLSHDSRLGKISTQILPR
ncbi:MAG: hypothetical protein WDN00_11285 [Limisphaerales bacterium]